MKYLLTIVEGNWHTYIAELFVGLISYFCKTICSFNNLYVYLTLNVILSWIKLMLWFFFYISVSMTKQSVDSSSIIPPVVGSSQSNETRIWGGGEALEYRKIEEKRIYNMKTGSNTSKLLCLINDSSLNVQDDIKTLPLPISNPVYQNWSTSSVNQKQSHSQYSPPAPPIRDYSSLKYISLIRKSYSKYPSCPVTQLSAD